MQNELVGEILSVARDRICRAHPYLAAALARLRPCSDEALATAATDGARLCCNPAWLRGRFLEDESAVNCLLLHALSHCLLGHIYAVKDDDPPSVHLACDLQVDFLLSDRMPEFCTFCADERFQTLKQRFGWMEELRELANALGKDAYVRDHREEIERLIALDEHALWQKAREEERIRCAGGGEGDSEGWRRMARGLRTGTGGSGIGSGTASLQQKATLGAAGRAEFATYLYKYASLRENARDDPDSFQTALYLYGREVCGAPLIEPLEYREERRIDTLVIAIDTSGSCTRGLTQRFLELTRDVLCSEGLFFRRFNLRILQCDVQVQRDDCITNMRAFERYIDDLTIVGGGGTDFRPVFQRIDEHIASGALRGLKGMLYFSDGRGIFPSKPPAYEVTFAFLKHRFDDIDVPNWVRRLVIDAPVPKGGEYYEY